VLVGEVVGSREVLAVGIHRAELPAAVPAERVENRGGAVREHVDQEPNPIDPLDLEDGLVLERGGALDVGDGRIGGEHVLDVDDVGRSDPEQGEDRGIAALDHPLTLELGVGEVIERVIERELVGGDRSADDDCHEAGYAVGPQESNSELAARS
jgi:hypothetical protein